MRRIILAGTMIAALAGCGGGGASEADRGNQAGAAPGSTKGAMTSPDGRSEVRADAAFSGLPEGIPAYPGADGRGGVMVGGASEEGEMRVMAFRTADSPDRVIAFYSEAATRAGFRALHRSDTGPSTVLGLERDNGDVMNITATGTASGTSVQIMAGRGRERRRP